MQNRVIFQILLLCIVGIYLATSAEIRQQHKYKRATTNSTNSTLKQRRKATTPKPGFFRTLFSVVYEQYQDTRDTIGTVNKLVNDNFLPENGSADTTTPVPGSNSTTTEDTRISRAEFNKIILRNLRGLRNLFQVELKQSLKQSETNYNEFRKNVTKEIGKFL
ncbi:unnamed protein product [Phyllotreta striolata]|uniref:Uncharacterized protein n=1 Tax=Phyllotreta striolata TaxID=444603 RepID=A0A9N9XNY1_PHYSR|nr:unnamed protein product [Phyllotreta striolata]